MRKEEIARLKSEIKDRASKNRDLSRRKATMKYRCTDRQDVDYRRKMDELSLERAGGRWDCRVLHLACGFLRGVAYHRMEASTHSEGYELMLLIMRTSKAAGATEEELTSWMAARSRNVAA